MDSLLVMATLVSLLLGTIMALVAWRLLRQHAERRAARVEALQALADADPAAAASIAPPPSFDYAPAARVRTAPCVEASEPDFQFADEPAPDTHFFEVPERMPESRWQARMAVALALAACAAVPYALYQMGVFSAIATAAPAGQAVPLELLSLRHMVDDHGSFTVTGLVQNPSGGRKTTGLVAVVYLFDDAGRFMATGRAAVDVPSLQAGEEASFTVSIPKMTGVSKYRVGFRLAEGGVIGHVDRRSQPPTETTEDGIGVGPGRTTASPAFLPRRSEGE